MHVPNQDSKNYAQYELFSLALGSRPLFPSSGSPQQALAHDSRPVLGVIVEGRQISTYKANQPSISFLTTTILVILPNSQIDRGTLPFKLPSPNEHITYQIYKHSS